MGEDGDRRVRQPDDVLDSLGLVADLEVLAVERRPRAEKVLLNAKRLLLGADEEDDKDWMRISALTVRTPPVPWRGMYYLQP